MKKLHSLAFYALFTPAIAFGSGALLAEEDPNGERDVGEQSMGADAEPEEQDSELHEESTKSKYNTDGESGEKKGNESAMQNKNLKESAPENGEQVDQD